MMTVDAQHKRWVENHALKAWRRLRAAGCSTLQLEDVRQECWIAWCKARDTFEPARGVPFGAYLHKGMQLHLRRYGLRLIESSAVHCLGDDVVEAAEARLLERGRSFGHQEDVLACMSRLTRIVVELLIEPPLWLRNELRAMRAKIAWCRQRGFLIKAPFDRTIVFQALRLSATERKVVETEMRRLAGVTRSCEAA